MPEEKRICASCLHESFLQSVINAYQTRDLSCNYCGRIAPTISLEMLAERCQRVFDHFYEPTAYEDKVVIYGRMPDGDPLSECLEELLKSSGSIIDDLTEILSKRVDSDSGDDPDPYYIRRHSLGHNLSAEWRRMSESLCNEARLFNPQAVAILERTFGPVITDQTHDGFDVFSIAGPGLGLDKFYRARVFQSEKALEWAMEHPERELGPLPKGQGRQGRMNTHGISVFYGATNAEIALAEVRPPVGSFVLIGVFHVKRRLRLLNLEELGRITVDTNASFFDPITVERVARCDFLSTLADRLTMPVMPENEDNGYLITQAIADFLSTHNELKLDGIVFRSAQRSPNQMSLSGRNVVLFHKASRVMRSEQKYRQGRSAQIMENDEDRRYWMPEIISSKADPAPTMNDWMDRDEREETLELDMNSMDIHEVKGIVLDTELHRVVYNS